MPKAAMGTAHCNQRGNRRVRLAGPPRNYRRTARRQEEHRTHYDGRIDRDRKRAGFHRRFKRPSVSRLRFKDRQGTLGDEAGLQRAVCADHLRREKRQAVRGRDRGGRRRNHRSESGQHGIPVRFRVTLGGHGRLAMGCAAFAAALGDVGGHDDGHDAPVGVTHAAPVRCRSRDDPRKDRQRGRFMRSRRAIYMVWTMFSLWGNCAAACACGSPASLVDDGNHQSHGWGCRCCSSRGCIS